LKIEREKTTRLKKEDWKCDQITKRRIEKRNGVFGGKNRGSKRKMLQS